MADVQRFTTVRAEKTRLTMAMPNGVMRVYTTHMSHFFHVRPLGKVRVAIRLPSPRPSKSWWKMMAQKVGI